ncbi:ras GTPase-activating protein-binding protein 1-like isoform X3 [Sinocyclocheilus rhinocerous]|uniref:ras GTPase-activating protein-binding protein 1-like isoform X3 n=1 Tax=Sinocyclocheilus rhinocerous TaxID=307959 RepID=UPI0007B7E0D4|nr:PREDICTED: ras GTPase-activating protein-binding protein 1-like isoform X3 [Sinocyclocheilus rhinocerous]
MVMEKPSAQLVGREFVRQYYTLLNQAPDYLHRFYGKNSSYVHGGLDNSGKPIEAVYGQSEIHKKVMALSFRDCHTKIRHVDAHATLNEGVVVQVLGELSNNMQPMRKFMQTFVLAPEGTVANKFYVHNDIFRYQDEVFGDSDSNNMQPMRKFMQTFVLAPEGTVANKFYVHNDIFRYQDEVFGDSDSEPPEESEEDVEELERVHSPEVVQEESAGYYEQSPCVEPEGPQEEVSVTPEPQPEPEAEVEPEPAAVELKPEPVSEPEVHIEEKIQRSPPSPTPADTAPTMPEDNRPRVEVKAETQTTAQRPQRDQRPRDQRPGPSPANRTARPGAVREGESGEPEVRRTVRYPDSHQLFVGNVPHDVDKNELKEFFEQYGTVLELRINSGGKLPNFGFVVFDDAEPVQKILSNRPVKLRGDVRLNVEEKKTRSAREGDRRDIRPRGPGGPRDRVGGSRGPPARGGMAQKPSFGAGRGAGPSEGRYAGPRQ